MIYAHNAYHILLMEKLNLPLPILSVNENKQRGIALATSQNLGKSSISFPIFEKN